MSPSDDLENSGIPEIDSAVSNIKEGDELAELGERGLAAGKYQAAISQLKSVRQRNDGQISETAGKLLKCAYRHAQRLIDEEPLPSNDDLEKICEELDPGEVSNIDTQGVEGGEQRAPQGPTYSDIRERIARGDRLRRDGAYDAAIESYQETKNIIDQHLAGSRRKRLKTEIDVNLRRARENKPPDVSDELTRIHRDIRERIAEGDRLRRGNEYDAAIESYQEAKHIIDQQLVGSSGNTLKTEIGLNLRNARKNKRIAVRRVEKLDGELQQLDHDLLARHGFELPYHRAAAGSETVTESNEVVYTPPLNPEVIDEIADYYRELGSFERQLATVASETGQSTAITTLLGNILQKRHPDVEKDPEGERDVVGAARNVLEGYLPLIEKSDSEGLSELEHRLEEVRSDIHTDDSGMESRDVARHLSDIRTWAGERARRVDLQSRADDLCSKWSTTAGEHLDLDVDVIGQLTGSDSGDPSLSQFEAGLETADRIVSLATRVETVREEYQTPLLDRLPEAFGQYLSAGQITPGRLKRLDKSLRVIETALSAHQRYPSYPFDRVVEYVCAELEGRTSDLEPDELIILVESATNVLDFLGRVDTAHPSVRPDEWQESIHTGLGTVSPELVRPLASLVDRMGETLWERHHLYQFSWEEFEQLVASVFESKGYETHVTSATSDEGVDIWARHRGDRVAIQVKQFDTSNRVGRPTLQKLASHFAKDDADRAIIVTSSTFTQTAREYVADFGGKMRLIDGTELLQMLTESDHPPPLAE